MGSWLALGECMVEIAPAEGGLCRQGFAGDTFNAAWYARQALPGDWAVDYATQVGRDAVSAAMLGFMADQGIGTGAIRQRDDATVGLYVISLKDGERSFSYWRGQSAARRMADDPAWLAQVLAGRRVIHFSGITLAILPPAGRAALCAALAQARAGGAMVSFDTNLRPRLWESPDAMRAGLMLGASVADVVLPSFDEETGLFGDATPAATAARYGAGGARVVAVKNGGDPLTLWTPESCATLDAVPVAQVVDTTAAGDSFAGVFLAGLAQARPLADAAGAAMRVAARVIQARGALVPGAVGG